MHQVQHGEAAITPNRKKECLPLSFAMFSTCCRSTKSTAPVGPEARYPTTLTPLAWRGNWKEGLQKRGPDLGPGSARTGILQGSCVSVASQEAWRAARPLPRCGVGWRRQLPVPGPQVAINRLVHGLQVQSGVHDRGLLNCFEGTVKAGTQRGAVESIMPALSALLCQQHQLIVSAGRRRAPTWFAPRSHVEQYTLLCRLAASVGRILRVIPARHGYICAGLPSGAAVLTGLEPQPVAFPGLRSQPRQHYFLLPSIGGAVHSTSF